MPHGRVLRAGHFAKIAPDLRRIPVDRADDFNGLFFPASAARWMRRSGRRHTGWREFSFSLRSPSLYAADRFCDRQNTDRFAVAKTMTPPRIFVSGETLR